MFTHTICWAQVEDNYRSLLKDTDVVIDKTNLPIVFIDVDGKMILRDDYILARMKIIHNGNGEYNYGDTIAHPNQNVDYEGNIALKYRGHSSFNQSNKKPFAFRTLKTSQLPAEGGEKKKVSILGMAKDSKWAMLAPWTDRSMIRDVLSFNLARPWMDFVSETRFCEVYLDDTYYGIYILTERVSQGKNRLNLKDSNEIENGNETDILVYIDRGADPYYESQYHPIGRDGLNLDRYIKYEYKFPDFPDFAQLPEGTKDFVDNEINSFEESFLSSDYTNPVTGYSSKIDVMSFVDYMLSTEVSNNADGYRLSTYLYKYSDSRGQEDGLDTRWKCALWDFNMAWGNTEYYDHVSNNMWHYDINYREDFRNDKEWVPFYWGTLLNDTGYKKKLRDRWLSYRSSNYSNESINFIVDSLTHILKTEGALQRNEKAWQIFSTPIWGVGYQVNSYDEEIEYLKNWISGRLIFMDNSFSESGNVGVKSIIKVDNENVQYYSLTGVKLDKRPEKDICIMKTNNTFKKQSFY